MADDQDAAARQAAELLPCIGPDRLRAQGCSVCVYCNLRLAVAAKLRERDERFAELKDELDNLYALEGDVEKQLRERIAALEKDVKDLTEDVENRGQTIMALEAENDGNPVLAQERIRALAAKLDGGEK